MIIQNITRTDYRLSGEIELEHWSKFYDGYKPIFCIEIGGDILNNMKIIRDIHIEALKYLKVNQVKIKDTILNHLQSIYPTLQSEYEYDDCEKDELMPNVESTDEFYRLIKLVRIHVHDIELEGISYLGFEFECTWDVEHGIGYLLHKNRIVANGGSDSSFLSWIAEEDKEKWDKR